MNFSSLTPDEIFEKLNTSHKGLSEKEAKLYLKKYGANELPTKKKGGGFWLFLQQFNSILIYILFIAAFISWQFKHYTDAYVILAVVLINAVISFFQRWRAERILAALKKMVTLYAKVIRNGVQKKIEARYLVVGDLVVLEAGDSAPADIRIIHSENATADESALTGESLPVEKDALPQETAPQEGTPKNMFFMGTHAISGYIKGVVVATGSNTRIGTIAEEIKKIKYKKTHFEKKVDELAIQMGVVAFAGALLTFLIGFYFRGLEFFDIFLFSVASLVSGVPEGLPAVLTIVLAIGASRMAKRNAIIKYLPSVETLGVANIICTDKTGTLTENVLTIQKIFVGSKIINVSGVGVNIVGNFLLGTTNIIPKYYPDLEMILKAGLFTSDASVVQDKGKILTAGEPVEIAIDVAGLKGKIEKSELLDKAIVIDKLPFDTRYKYKANLVNLRTESEPDKKIFASGAFEVLLEKSSHVYEDGKIVKLSSQKREEILSHALDMASGALKVLGVAFKDAMVEQNEIIHQDVSELVFLGLLGMMDPPAENVKDAILKCRNAGVKVLMLTGDHKETAIAVAKYIGLLPKETHIQGKVFTEAELKDLSDEEFKNIVNKAVIFARVTPETKFKIAKTLQEDGNVVAMTGDGINDAPALKQADIGLAMGIRGTDVAKEASGIILADDNFSSIVDAILEGRTVFSNVKKTSFYLITTNVAEDLTIISALSLGLALPLLPIQILWLNLVTDSVLVVALASEPAHNGILNEKPRSYKERILTKDVFPLIIFTGVLMVIGTVILFMHFLPHGIDKARTVAFSFMAFSQLFNAVNMRSLDLSVFKIGFFSNRFLIISLAASVLIQFFVIYTPFFQEVFQFEQLNAGEWSLIILSSSLIFFIIEIYKAFKRRS